ncbi:MAG: hypothetical protein L6R40_002358 [Gallowayella cf. fulva]|nr:MAG: hypothetical protein L6R40_002358 [Xanthomendoza cf. fulva]
MTDLAVARGEYPDENSEFAGMRDSLFMLSVMNQYSIKQQMPARESERLLRVALFSHSLEVQPKDGITQPIEYRRKALAKSFREQRKKGVVPVLLSLGWFMFALALSIEAAFGQLGSSQAAHNLAMGLLLAWLPVLVTATTVNRNPSGAEPLRRQLNEFVEEVLAQELLQITEFDTPVLRE